MHIVEGLRQVLLAPYQPSPVSKHLLAEEDTVTLPEVQVGNGVEVSSCWRGGLPDSMAPVVPEQTIALTMPQSGETIPQSNERIPRMHGW